VFNVRLPKCRRVDKGSHLPRPLRSGRPASIPVYCVKRQESKSSRVDQGSHLPRPPTDPDVRHSRIRLLRSRFRCLTVHGPDNDCCWHRITRQKSVERIPLQPSALRSTRQPGTPSSKQVVAEEPEPLPVSGDTVVRTVTPEFPHKFCVLPSDRFVAVIPAPKVDGLQRPAEAIPCCLALVSRQR
jgi:hypothetical protein